MLEVFLLLEMVYVFHIDIYSHQEVAMEEVRWVPVLAEDPLNWVPVLAEDPLNWVPVGA